jgi:hypothetical protein
VRLNPLCTIGDEKVMSEQLDFDFSPSRLPENLRAAIGYVVAASTQTESTISHAIAGCLGIDAEYMIAVTQHMPLPLKFSVLYSVAEIRLNDLDALDELDKLAGSAKSALEQRNAVVHDSWAVSKKDGSIYRISQSARTRVEADMVSVTVDEVVKVARAVENSGLALVNFLSVHNLFPAVPLGRPRGHKSRAARKKRRSQAV